MTLTLFQATLLPGLFLLLLGGALLWNHARLGGWARALPRSNFAAWVFFGLGAVWFVFRLTKLGESDLIFFQTPTPVVIGFAALAVLSFIYTPDFLAVRGLCVLMLMVAEPLLAAAYMHYEFKQRLFMVTAVYLGLGLALYLGAAPYRLRDFFDWLFRQPSRPRVIGAALLLYGLVTSAAAFTY